MYNNTNKNAQVDAQGMNVRRESNNQQSMNNSVEAKLAAKRKQAMDEAVKMSRSVYRVFEVTFETIQKRINAAKRKQSIGRETVAAKWVELDWVGQHHSMTVYVDVVRTADELGCITPTVVLRATTDDTGDALTAKQAVNYTNTRKYEDTFVEVLGAVMTKAIAAAYEDEATRTKLARDIAYHEEREYENEHYWDKQVEATKKHIENRLEECGMNALKLADALVEAYKNTDGTIHYGEVPTLALWVNYKAEIVRRLKSLGDGPQPTAPDLEEGTAGKNSNTNDDNHAPGLEEDLERVEKFLRELPDRMDELNGCEDEVKIDNGNFVVLADVDDDGEIYAHLEVSIHGEYYEEGDEEIGNGWSWTINDDDDITECLNDIRRFFEGPDPAVGYFEKKNN